MFSSCENATNSNRSKIEVLDLASDFKADLSDLFDTVRIIPLETSDFSLVGIQIKKVEYFEDRFYLLNVLNSRSNILCFDKNGAFLFKIDNIGNGPGEYTYLGDFLIDKAQRKLVLFGGHGQVLYYNLDGQYLERKTMPDESFLSNVAYYNDTVYIAKNNADLPPVGYNILGICSRNLEIIDKYSVHYHKNFGDLGFVDLAINKDQIYYYDIADTIYNITNRGDFNPSYVISQKKDLQNSKRILLNKDFSGPDEAAKFMAELYRKKELICISSFFINDKWILLNSIEAPTVGFGYISSVLFYDRDEKKSYNLKNVSFDYWNIKSLNNIEVIGKSENGFFLLMKDELIDLDKKLLRKSLLSPDEIALLVERTEEDNPIIVEIK